MALCHRVMIAYQLILALWLAVQRCGYSLEVKIQEGAAMDRSACTLGGQAGIVGCLIRKVRSSGKAGNGKGISPRLASPFSCDSCETLGKRLDMLEFASRLRHQPSRNAWRYIVLVL